MRAVFFERPLEYHLEVQGNQWTQGALIEGSLVIKNASSDSVIQDSVSVKLAYGILKDIKVGKENCWEILLEEELDQKVTWNAGEEKRYSWKLQIPSDSPINDKSGGLFILYGGDTETTSCAKIDITVGPLPIFDSFIQSFETKYKFKKKYLKFKKGRVEVKLDPPESREFIKVKQALVYLRVQDDVLEVEYDFKTEGLGRADEHTLGVKKQKKQVQQSFQPEQYMLPGGFPNRVLFQQSIDEALHEVRNHLAL